MASITLNKASGGTLTISAEDNTDVTSFVIPDAGIPEASAPPTIQTFTSSGTWTKPTGCKTIKVTVVGGGGSGNASSSFYTTSSNGGGGGSGGAGFVLLDATTLTSETVTVGAGGVSYISGDYGVEDNGDTSSFGSHITATGGGYGDQGSLGLAGTVTGVNVVPLFSSHGSADPSSVLGSGGGSCALGTGGKGVFNPTQSNRDGAGYGAGGGGTRGNSTTFTGASGADGIVIVEEFY